MAITVKEFAQSLAEIERFRKTASLQLKKIDSMISGLRSLQQQLSVFVGQDTQSEVPAPGEGTTNSDKPQTLKKRGYGEIRTNIISVLRSGHYTTRGIYQRLVELNKMPSIETPEGQNAYRNHRGTISNMFKKHEIISAEPEKIKNCEWMLAIKQPVVPIDPTLKLEGL